MDHSRKMLRFRDMLLFLNPPTQHEALLRARSASLRCARNKHSLGCYLYKNQHLIETHALNHNYFTRHRNNVIVPNARLRSTEQSVIRNALRIWDDIPAFI